MFGRKSNSMHRVPSLVDLCIQVAIDNVRYLGNVGETDFHLLERILPHCTHDQLKHVEDCTEGRDLSPVTNELWKKFFERHFGERSVNLVVESMAKEKVKFSWRQLYEVGRFSFFFSNLYPVIRKPVEGPSKGLPYSRDTLSNIQGPMTRFRARKVIQHISSLIRDVKAKEKAKLQLEDDI